MRKRRARNEGSVYRSVNRHGRVTFFAACSGGSPRFSGKTQAEAVAKRDAYLTANPQRIRKASRSAGTFGQFILNWLSDHDGRHNTVTAYETIFRRWVIPAIGDVSIALLTSGDIRRAMRGAIDAGKHSTAEHIRIYCRTVLNAAKKQGRIAFNPAEDIKPHRYDKRKAAPIHGDELRALLEYIAGKECEALVLVALMGLRRGELCGLQWQDYANGTLRIERQYLRVKIAPKKYSVDLFPVKSERGNRSLKLPEAVREALERHRARQREMFMALGAPDAFDGSHIFTTRIGGRIDPRSMDYRFTAIFKAAGIAHRAMHNTRHTTASLLLAEGADLQEVMNWLGHARYATTVDIYGHSIPTGIARTAERMEKILGGKKS